MSQDATNQKKVSRHAAAYLIREVFDMIDKEVERSVFDKHSALILRKIDAMSEHITKLLRDAGL